MPWSSEWFLSDCPTKILYAFLISPMHNTYPAHLILLDLIALIIGHFGEEYEFWKSLCIFLQPHVTSSLFGPNVLLSTLFSNTLNLCSSLNVREEFSHPYKTTGKTIVETEMSVNFYWTTRRNIPEDSHLR
jgi:hypothetical protein